MTQTDKRIELVAEVSMSNANREAIAKLLLDRFPDYPGDQLFYPQPPHFRLLHWFEGTRLTGHLAGVIRSIRVGSQIFTIYGLADLCTDREWSGKRIANALIEQAEYLARMQSVPFLMAMTESPDFYEKSGFQTMESRCKWLAFMEGKSLGVFHRIPPYGLMVKATGEYSWPDGDVDLMGPLF